MATSLATTLAANPELAVTIATIATVGFAINLGVATVAPAAWRLMKDENELSVINDRTKRIISKFAKTRYIYAYLTDSIVYMASALVLLGFFLLQDDDLLLASLLSLGVEVLLTIVISGILLLKAAWYSQEDMDKNRRGYSYMLDSLSIQCIKCGAMNKLTDMKCKSCGHPTGVVDASQQSATGQGANSK